jgi:MoaA/NifB/PqqE/SkfB family radical SAM enzyme
MAALLSRNLRAEMSLVLTRWNAGELETAISLANDLGVAEFHFILPQPTPESAADGSDLSPDEWDALAARVRQLARTSAVPIGLDYGTRDAMPRQLCGTLALRQVYVDALGRIPFCCQLSRYGTGAEPILGDLTTESLADVLGRAESTYSDFTAETVLLHQIGKWDRSDDYPCLSCARRHGRTGFLADFPAHPWAALASAAS